MCISVSDINALMSHSVCDCQYRKSHIEKTVTAGKVRKEMEDLRYPLPAENEPRLKIQCFGNFEIGAGGGRCNRDKLQ